MHTVCKWTGATTFQLRATLTVSAKCLVFVFAMSRRRQAWSPEPPLPDQAPELERTEAPAEWDPGVAQVTDLAVD